MLRLAVTAITRPQLASLIDRDYTWLDTRCRRARAHVSLPEVKAGTAHERIDASNVDVVPLKDLSQGKWARFDAEDAINMAVAIELEDAGVGFREATRIALNTSAAQVLHHPLSAPDLWLAVVIDRDADGQGRAHRVGSLVQVAEAIAAQQTDIDRNQRPEQITAVITVNASAVLRRLIARANKLGLSQALGWSYL